MHKLNALSDSPEFVAAFSRAAADVGSHSYYVADAYTHAPITPYAPLTGVMGIAADVARAMPGMTALRADDVSPARRESLAATCERIAATELRSWELNIAAYEAYAAAGNAVGMANTLARANRAAEESDRASDRAHAIRAALASMAA